MQDTRQGTTAENYLSFKYWLKGGIERTVCVERQGEWGKKMNTILRIGLTWRFRESRTPCGLKSDIAL